MNIKLRLDPVARLQRFLGRELIADPNLAIVEFVKNAYDAGASEVFLDFRLGGTLEEHELWISDNGVGMDLPAFEKDWMHPGYSQKVLDTGKKAADASAASTRQAARIPVGEKGLGRLAAGRLGSRLDVYTRSTADAKWLHVEFDWERFDRMDVPMRAIEVKYDHASEPEYARHPRGTSLQISKLMFDWSQRVRGRKVPGRADTRLGRLRQDLALLLHPSVAQASDFSMILAVDYPPLARLAGPIRVDAPEVRDYVWEFEISEGRRGLVVSRRVRRSERVAVAADRPKDERRKVRINPDNTDRPTTLRSGPFRGAFYYSPPQLAARSESLGFESGVHVYRDGLRVEPYGSPGNDWLGAQARKASRQGYAAIQPKQLQGFVAISRSDNPELLDMSNRQGMVENEAHEDFLGHAAAEFRKFESVVLAEVVEPGWAEPESTAQAAARRAQTFGSALVRAFTHSLRQPVAGLGGEITVLRSTVEKLDEEIRPVIEGVIERAGGHLRTIDDVLARLMSLQALDVPAAFRDVDLAEIVDEVSARVKAAARASGVDIEVEGARDARVTTQPTAIEEALAELARNAIEATREAGRTGPVRIGIEKRDRTIEMRVTDTGQGIPVELRDVLFTAGVSTKGRTGFGLINVGELLALAGATVAVESTGVDGSVIRISLPRDGVSRRSRT